MREQLGDSVYDVVGTLLEGVRLEELVMQAVLKDSAQEVEVAITRNLEQAFQQYRKALEESALAGHHIDHTAISKDDARSREMRLVPWDVERFTFATTGELQLTLHEWQLAQRLGDSYWVYAVENALTEPALRRIQNPAAKLPPPEEILRTVKVVFADWKQAAEVEP